MAVSPTDKNAASPGSRQKRGVARTSFRLFVTVMAIIGILAALAVIAAADGSVIEVLSTTETFGADPLMRVRDGTINYTRPIEVGDNGRIGNGTVANTGIVATTPGFAFAGDCGPTIPVYAKNTYYLNLTYLVSSTGYRGPLNTTLYFDYYPAAA